MSELISYLVHRIQAMSMETRDPCLLIVDETAPMLRNKLFADETALEDRAHREKNLRVWKVYQDFPRKRQDHVG